MGKYFRLAAIGFAVVLLSTGAFGQLAFEPNIVNGVIQFDDTPVGESSNEWVTMIGNPMNDVQQEVNISVQHEYFSANPTFFRVEAGQQVAVTFTFSPEEEGDFETTFRVTAGQPMGRVFVYDSRLAGTGIAEPAPEISVAPASVELLVEEEDGSDDASLTIRNTGEVELVWNIPDFNVEWLTVAPRNGRIAAGRSSVVNLETAALPGENGEYEVTLRILSNDPDQGEIRVPVLLTLNLPVEDVQVLHLRQGWNMVSLNVDPNQDYRDNGVLTMPALTSNIQEHIILIKNYAGGFCLPDRGFWGIREWDVTQGYWIKTSAAVDWEIIGEPIAEDAPIHLRAGWNTIAYYPRRDAEGRILFQALEQAGLLRIIKGPLGQFYIPGLPFYYWTLHPNDGVMVRVSQEVDFRYPVE